MKRKEGEVSTTPSIVSMVTHLISVLQPCLLLSAGLEDLRVFETDQNVA